MQLEGMKSLLEPPPVKSEKSRVWAITITVLLVALAVVLWLTLRYYPEKQSRGTFL